MCSPDSAAPCFWPRTRCALIGRMFSMRATLPAAAAVGAAPAAVQPSRGRQWTWLVAGLGLGLLTGGIVANPLGSPRATALDIAGGTLLAASVALYFVEAPKEPPPPGGSRRAQVGIAPLPEGGAVALSGRF